MKRNNALIIDDEPDIRELLKITLNRMGMDCQCAENLQEARLLLNQNEFDICLTDMRLPDGDGVEFVSYAQKNYSQMPIAVITAHGNMEAAIQALKYGAFDFLSKPVDLEHLRSLVKNAINLPPGLVLANDRLIGESPAIQKLRKMISKLSRSQAPVYISGESGVGKELVARMIHEQGPRSGQEFIPVNCGAIPHELMEREFFGHKKGSFTGAGSDNKGLFQAADGGTLFLDEVAELPQNMQVKLLRAIQEKKVRPIGEQIEVPVNVRVLSATHKNLSTLVKQGTFRQDLFYRINVIELHVPPLRERAEDTPILVEHIVKRIASELEISIPKISQQALDALKSHHFSGNVRELENILERAITLSDGKVIDEKDLMLSAVIPVHSGPKNPASKENVELESYLVDVEKQAILDALDKTGRNKTKAAKLLGISFRALRYRLQKLGLD